MFVGLYLRARQLAERLLLATETVLPRSVHQVRLEATRVHSAVPAAAARGFRDFSECFCRRRPFSGGRGTSGLFAPGAEDDYALCRFRQYWQKSSEKSSTVRGVSGRLAVVSHIAQSTAAADCWTAPNLPIPPADRIGARRYL